MSLEVDEEQLAEPDAYDELLRRLSRQSVTKHFNPYEDIDWDAPEMLIDADDPRWELDHLHDPLGGTAWYRSQPAGTRSRIGLHLVATRMRLGLQFESILKRGLLEYASKLANKDPEFRYIYHEVIEEAYHSMMFQEFVNRSGLDVEGMPRIMQIGSRGVVKLGRRFPALFFMFVLGGEDPIDYVQREALRSGSELHPLIERIMRIHVTEEARHLSFARHYLKRNVPRLGFARRTWLSIETPVILGLMAATMLYPSPQIVRTYRIPKVVLREAFSDNPSNRQHVRDSLRKVRRLAEDLGLMTPVSKLIWKAFGIWEPTTA
jgi:hypothetical protein